jgi:hypothetical protein
MKTNIREYCFLEEKTFLGRQHTGMRGFLLFLLNSELFYHSWG